MGNYKTGIFHWFGYILPMEERIRLIKEAGFDYVMLWWEDEEYPCIISRMKFITGMYFSVLQYIKCLKNVNLGIYILQTLNI